MASMNMNALLQQAMTGGAAGMHALRDALAQHEDPRMRMLAEWAAQQQQQQPEEADPASQATRPEVLTHRSMEERKRLLRKTKSLAVKLERQREISDTLAAALGACYLCWGDDLTCEQCLGQGNAGWREPDADLFLEYVAPAIRRMRSHHPGEPVSGNAESTNKPTESATSERSFT